MVERDLAKVEVAGSSPVIRSSNKMKGEKNSPFFLFPKRKIRFAQLLIRKLGSFICFVSFTNEKIFQLIKDSHDRLKSLSGFVS